MSSAPQDKESCCQLLKTFCLPQISVFACSCWVTDSEWGVWWELPLHDQKVWRTPMKWLCLLWWIISHWTGNRRGNSAERSTNPDISNKHRCGEKETCITQLAVKTSLPPDTMSAPATSSNDRQHAEAHPVHSAHRLLFLYSNLIYPKFIFFTRIPPVVLLRCWITSLILFRSFFLNTSTTTCFHSSSHFNIYVLCAVRHRWQQNRPNIPLLSLAVYNLRSWFCAVAVGENSS